MSRIVIVSGPPGAGKSTVARGLALTAPGPLSAHMHTDDFYGYIRKGFVPPWLPESRAQNTVLMEAMAAAAAIIASGGYEVLIDGIVGTWFLDPWLRVAREHRFDLRYVVLLPTEAETLARATARRGRNAMRDAGVTQKMWRAFEASPPPPGHALDTTGQNPGETVALVREGLALGRFALG